jgi:hypothetical protein
MVPALAREQNGFQVERVANEKQDTDTRTPHAPVDTFVDRRDVHGRANRGALTSLTQEANARRPAIDHDERRGRLRLDVSPHSRKS